MRRPMLAFGTALLALGAAGCASVFNAPETQDACMNYVGIELKGACAPGSRQFHAHVVNAHPKRAIAAELGIRAAPDAPEADRSVDAPPASAQEIGCLAAAHVKACKFKP